MIVGLLIMLLIPITNALPEIKLYPKNLNATLYLEAINEANDIIDLDFIGVKEIQIHDYLGTSHYLEGFGGYATYSGIIRLNHKYIKNLTTITEMRNRIKFVLRHEIGHIYNFNHMWTDEYKYNEELKENYADSVASNFERLTVWMWSHITCEYVPSEVYPGAKRKVCEVINIK